MEFKKTKFDITSNISLIVSLAYIHGHPIVETKKTKINYKGTIIEVNRENKNNEVLMNKLISKSLYSIFSIELVNYLNRLINGDNLYEVYVNNSNQADKPEELIDYIFKPEKQCSSAGALNIESKYIKDLMNKDRNIDLDLLDQHRNSKYPTCVHNFEEIEYVPICTYIHPTLAKNRGETVHIMHLGLLFQLLTRIKGLPEFNTQASISALNSAMRSNQIGVTMETVNKSQYDDLVKENERLQGKLKKKQGKIDELKQIVVDIRTQNTNLQETINNQTAHIEELEDMLVNMQQNADVADRRNNEKLTQIANVGIAIHNQISTIQVKDIKQHKTNDVLILYTSAEKPRDEDLRAHTPEGCVWIATFNGQPRNFRYPNVPRDRVVIFESNSNRLDSFRSLLEKNNVARFIRQTTPQRDILIRIDQQEEFLQVIQEELDRDDNYPVVNDLDVATLDQISNEEITFKRNLLEQYNPCLININRYKRRLYAEVNNELVLVEEMEHPETYTWKYRYGPSGRLTANIDLNLLQHSRFTNELETRINYE